MEQVEALRVAHMILLIYIVPLLVIAGLVTGLAEFLEWRFPNARWFPLNIRRWS